LRLIALIALYAVGCQNWATTRVGLVLGGWFVFVDQTVEDGSVLDPFCWGIGVRVIRRWWWEVERAVRASTVVGAQVLGQDGTRCPSPKISIGSVTSVWTVRTNRSV
jgi:hypothetical protein